MADVKASLAALTESTHVATTAVRQVSAVAVAWATYAALAAAYAQAATDDYTASYALVAADAAYATAGRAAGCYLQLYGFAARISLNRELSLIHDRLADKLLELVDAAPVG